MKHIYLGRHGETVLNAESIKQGVEAKLSERGKKQSKVLGNRFLSISFDIIISSNYARAVETAEIIAAITKKQIAYTLLGGELKNPSELLGKNRKDPETQKIQQTIHTLWRQGNGKYSDEENFSELRDRVSQFMEYLIARPEERLLVVSHGFFMRAFLSCVIFGGEVTPDEYLKIVETHSIHNAGITYFQHQDSEAGEIAQAGGARGIWRLITWNDHAHLG